MYRLLLIFSFVTSISLIKSQNNVVNKFDLSVNVNPHTGKEAVKGSHYFNSLKVFQLPSSLGLIGQISKIIPYKNKLILLDKTRYNANAIFIFDFDGKPICCIKQTGKGPGEYIHIGDITADEDEVFVFDSKQRKIISYSIDTGHFIKERKIDFPFMSFEKYNGYTYYLMFPISTMTHWLHIEDPNNKIVAKYLSIKNHPIVPDCIKNRPFFKYNDNVIFCHSYIDTIFQLQKSNITPYIILNSEKLRFSKSSQNISLGSKTYKPQLCLGYNRYYENSNFLCFQFNKDGQTPYYGIFDKNSKYFKVQRYFNHDIINMVRLSDMPGYGNKLVLLESADRLKTYPKHINETLVNHPQEENKKILNNIDPLGNPIIFIFSNN